jgi:hypothetical protein
LLIGQILFYFAPLVERRAPVLNNFETFLAVFVEAFEDHDKICSATTKIMFYDKDRTLHLYMRRTSDY